MLVPVHAFTRVPNELREEHESWDGLILPATDPWGETCYPPNGWCCSCGLEPIAEAEMCREKGKPDTAPQVSYRKVKDPLTGEQVNYPDGVDFGWAYAPGRIWALGLEPAPVDPPLKCRVWNWAGLLRQPQDLPKLEEIARPLPKGKGARDLGLAADGRPDEELRKYITILVRAHDRFRKENRERPITEWERWQEWDAVNRRYVEQFFLMLRHLKQDDNISMDRDNLILDAAGHHWWCRPPCFRMHPATGRR